MTLPNESNARDRYALVLAALCVSWPMGLTARQLGVKTGVRGRQLGGALRWLKDRGAVEAWNGRWLADQAAVTAWNLLGS